MNLCSKIDFETAKLLNNRVYADCYDDKYAAELLTCTFENYLGSVEYKEGDYIEEGEHVHGKFYYAPTYAEVIDWLFSKGIVIKFDPVYTFSLACRIGYFYKVYKMEYNDALLTCIFEDTEYFSSFELAIKDIIKYLIENKFID